MANIVLQQKEDVHDPVLQQKAENKLAAASCQLLLSVSFFATALIKLKRKVDWECPTMATDGKGMFFNPHFVDKMSVPELGFVVLHEVFHYMLGHPYRRGSRQPFIWNMACDYAVNTMLADSINFACNNRRSSSGISWPVMPQGLLYDTKYNGMTAEQIYDLLIKDAKIINIGGAGDGDDENGSNGKGKCFSNGMVDDHKKWGQDDSKKDAASKKAEQNNWTDTLTQGLQEFQKMCGNLPAGFDRIFNSIIKPKKNWRLILQEFITPEADDYGFAPPDRRFSDYDFFLPDLNDCENGSVKDGYFWIDTSGSIGDKELTLFYSEIVGAMDQFKGKLAGKLGFFDAIAYEPEDFANITDILAIRPRGGGGTEFKAPFEMMEEKGMFMNAQFVVILTDGYCEFPPESIAQGLKVLWVITTSSIDAPWGQTVHLDMYNER